MEEYRRKIVFSSIVGVVVLLALLLSLLTFYLHTSALDEKIRQSVWFVTGIGEVRLISVRSERSLDFAYKEAERLYAAVEKSLPEKSSAFTPRAFERQLQKDMASEREELEQLMEARRVKFGLTFFSLVAGILASLGIMASVFAANLRLQSTLKAQSLRDPLTQLFNRRYLEETMSREFARAQRNSTPLSFLIMDIDFFKKVNDTYGHDAGDAILVAFGRMLATRGRKEDIACRLGGEEFVLVLPGASLEQAMSRAEEICAATRALLINFGGKVIKITVSVGASVFPDLASTPEDLMTQADMALYEAKQSGRDCAISFKLRG